MHARKNYDFYGGFRNADNATIELNILKNETLSHLHRLKAARVFKLRHVCTNDTLAFDIKYINMQ